ncbi:hypothetical protein [Streptomyces marianii]|uniref:DNA binding HTH domain-containing protein n=1 Tax=Streptomyces marianii TaxID=1817406 RepID=A0A5R9E687_9ACTN|nr:hypothetical protein [Streptomyces marianii]TLQ45508.1 hypothetical protein FEF34_23085 [Streptomyces marianii]
MPRTAMSEDPRVRRLEHATQRLTDAEKEFQDALIDLLTHGPRGAQAAATRITGMNRDTLRRRHRDHEVRESRESREKQDRAADAA